MIFNCSHKTFKCHKYLKIFSTEIRSSILTIWFWKRSHHAHLFNQELDKESTIVKTIKETWGHRQHIRNQQPVHYWSKSKIIQTRSWCKHIVMAEHKHSIWKIYMYTMIWRQKFSCKIINSGHNRGPKLTLQKVQERDICNLIRTNKTSKHAICNRHYHFFKAKKSRGNPYNAIKLW